MLTVSITILLSYHALGYDFGLKDLDVLVSANMFCCDSSIFIMTDCHQSCYNDVNLRRRPSAPVCLDATGW